MELRVLGYFLMVAREENITKAAQLLHISQPTLSRQLMQLEEELGVKLFLRKSHNITLTEDGILLKRRAGELLSLADKTKQEFLRQEDNLTGEVAIGAGELLSVDYLAEIIAAFREKYPLVTFDFYSGNADNITDHIERGLLDMGLLLEPIDIRKYEFFQMVPKEQWGALVCENSSLAEKEFIRPEDVIDKPIIAPKGKLIHDNLANLFGEYYDKLKFTMSYNLLYNGAMMAQKHMGIVICINLHTKYEGLRFVPFASGREMSSTLVWKKDQPFSDASIAFIDFLREMPK